MAKTFTRFNVADSNMHYFVSAGTQPANGCADSCDLAAGSEQAYSSSTTAAEALAQHAAGAAGAAPVTGSQAVDEAVPADLPAADVDASSEEQGYKLAVLPGEQGYELAVLEVDAAAVATIAAHEGAATRENDAPPLPEELLVYASAETAIAGEVHGR